MTDPMQATQMQLFWEHFKSIISSVNITDILDIAIVAFLIYKLIGLIRETRAGQLVKGVVAVLLLYLIAHTFKFLMLENILQFILTYGVVVLLVLFQPELRKVLEQVGRTSISSLQLFATPSESKEERRRRMNEVIDAVVEGCTMLSQARTGALTVIERKTKIGDIISTGTIINATPSSELMQNIFFHNSPLHDGAMVVREGRFFSAGCFLPLSQNNDISRMLGTRHRAALGMSEVSDAVVVVVSEETGAISVALNGKLQLKLSPSALKAVLYHQLIATSEIAEITPKESKKLNKLKKAAGKGAKKNEN
ncbi:MAG: diadenylate cyclase CdaA [Angelakisella sp.]